MSNKADKADKGDKSDAADKVKGESNAVTTKAGLVFNVNTVKNKMKDYFKGQGADSPMFSGGQIATTAVLQRFLESIVRECKERVGLDRAKLRTVNRESLQYTLMLNEDYKNYFSSMWGDYNKDMMYGDQLPVDSKHLDVVVAKIDPSMTLTPRAKNLVCFLMVRVFTDLVSTSTQFLSFAKKKSLDAHCINHVVRNRFRDNLCSELIAAVITSMKASDYEMEDTTGVAEEDIVKKLDDGKQPEEQDEAPVKETKETKDKKGDSKDKKAPVGKKADSKTKQIEEDADELEASEEEAAEEVIEVKKKPVGTKASTPAPKAAKAKGK